MRSLFTEPRLAKNWYGVPLMHSGVRCFAEVRRRAGRRDGGELRVGRRWARRSSSVTTSATRPSTSASSPSAVAAVGQPFCRMRSKAVAEMRARLRLRGVALHVPRVLRQVADVVALQPEQLGALLPGRVEAGADRSSPPSRCRGRAHRSRRPRWRRSRNRRGGRCGRRQRRVGAVHAGAARLRLGLVPGARQPIAAVAIFASRPAASW